MNVNESPAMRTVPWAIPFLTIGIFLADLMTPVGIAVSILYVIPLLLTVFRASERESFYFCALATCLLWVGLLLKPSGSSLQYGVLNRTLGTAVLWVLALGLVRFRRLKQEAGETGRALMAARVEQAHAEGLMMAAQEARAYADTAVLGATASRRAMEAQLLVSQLRLEGIIESAMDAIITVNEDQQIVLFNTAAEQMFRCADYEAIGQPVGRFLPAQFRDAHRHHVQAFGQSGVTSRKMGQLGTVMGLRSNGEEFPIEAAISHMVVEGQNFYTVILRDITERKRAEQLLRQSEERYRRLIVVSPYAILVDRGGSIIFANDQATRLFGATKADQILGKSQMDLFHPEYRGMIRERIHKLLEGSAEVPMIEEKIVTLDRRSVDVEVNAVRFVDEEGPAVLMMLRDISERKRLQSRLRQTERIAELGTLASGMAHEIGTPMNVILGRAEYLLDRVTEEPVKKGLQTIVSQVERITRVMNQLLAFARRKPPERVPLVLKDILEDGLELFQERLAKGCITVELMLDETCPRVLADPDQMSQVFINLVMNAVHAMPDGGTLRIGLVPEQEQVKLTVADTGHGISHEVVKKIFEPFFTTKEFGQGTGLGLTVVKGIIEEHQGSITVESKEGKGTTFTILLPVCSSS